MTEVELKTLCDDVQLACAEGYPAGCEQAVKRVCTNSGHFREGLMVRLARAATTLLDLLEWHTEGAESHQRLSMMLLHAESHQRLSMMLLHAEHQAQRRTHEAAAQRIRAALETL